MCNNCGCEHHEGLTSIVLHVNDMSCENCKNSIETALNKIPGVHHVHIHLNEKTVAFDLDDNATLNQVKTKINDLGFSI